MFRYIFTALIVYLGYRYLKSVFHRTSKPDDVKGSKKSEPLNLNDQNVVDAHFEDIDEKEEDS